MLAGEKPSPNFNFSCAESGAFPHDLTVETLEKAYGKAKVETGTVQLGEGQSESGTILLASAPGDRAEILWKDADQKRLPRLVKISALDNEPSHWKSLGGLQLGMSLKEVEKINGRPFRLRGFGWDYSGTVSSWEGGALQKEWKGKCPLVVRFFPEQSRRDAFWKDYKSMAGERDFSSQRRSMQRLNPRI